MGPWLRMLLGPKGLQTLWELKVEELLVKRVKPFVLKLACPVGSEVDGSQLRISVCRSVRKSQFWHSLLPVIPS